VKEIKDSLQGIDLEREGFSRLEGVISLFILEDWFVTWSVVLVIGEVLDSFPLGPFEVVFLPFFRTIIRWRLPPPLLPPLIPLLFVLRKLLFPICCDENKFWESEEEEEEEPSKEEEEEEVEKKLKSLENAKEELESEGKIEFVENADGKEKEEGEVGDEKKSG